MECEGTGVRVGIVRPGPSSTEQGTTWDEDTINEVVAVLVRAGACCATTVRCAPTEMAQAVLAMVVRAQGHPLRRARGAARSTRHPRSDDT